MNGIETFFKELLLSFFARPFYSDLAWKKDGIGTGFILMLTAVLLLPGGMGIYTAARGLVAAAQVVTQKMPQMDFNDGKLAIDAPSPHIIQFAEQAAIEVDTGTSIANLPEIEKRMRQKNILILFGADGAVTAGRSPGEFRVYNYVDMKKPFVITHANWKKIGAEMARWGVPVFILFVTIFAFIGVFLYNFIATFLGAIVVLVAGAVMGTGLAFDGAMRLAAAARFPAGVIAGVAGAVASIPYFGWLVLFGYLVFAAVCARRPKPPAVTEAAP